MTIDDLLLLHPVEHGSEATLLQTLTAVTELAAVITHGYASLVQDEVRWVTRIVHREDGQELHRDEWTGPHLSDVNRLIGAGQSPEKEDFLAVQGAPYVTLTTITLTLPNGVVFNRRRIRVPRHVQAVRIADATFQVTDIGHVLVAWETTPGEASIPAPLNAVWHSGDIEGWGSLPQAPRAPLMQG